MTVDGPWRRDAHAQRLLNLLAEAGHAAYFVGGCVRNAILGAPVGDIDISTAALPNDVISLVEAAGMKAVPTGIEHGTVTVVAGGTPFEVTTFRRDVETDGRRAVIAFADDVHSDALRRDFTMNALYATAEGSLVDPLGGLPDLQARRVRFIGDAETRIREDYLRILRYFRFHAWYGDPQAGLDGKALAACAGLAEGLDQLSAERIGGEMRKCLGADDPAPAIAAMGQAGILARVLPGAAADPLAVLVHLETLIGAPPDPLRRLAILGAEDAARKLRLSRKEAARLDLLANAIHAEAGAAEIAWRHGAGAARDVELLRAARFGAPLPADLDARIATGADARFPVSGADLKDRYKGPELGARLAELEARWIASGFTLDRDALLG